MKIKVTKSQFLGAINIVKDAIGGDGLAISRNIKIDATGKKIVLTATNLSLTVRTELDGSVEESGATTVPAVFLAAAVGAMNEGVVEFNLEKGSHNAYLIGDGIRYKVSVLDAAEFPEMKLPAKDKNVITVRKVILREMLRKVAYAVDGSNGTRLILQGINIRNTDKETIRLEATDGRRLSRVSASTDGDIATNFSVTIPTAATKIIQRLLPSSDVENSVSLAIEKGIATFFTDEWTVQTKTIDGAYPETNQVIPVNFAAKVSVDRETFADAIRQVAVSVDKDYNKMMVQLSKNALTISATSSLSSSKREIPVRYDGAKIEFYLNPFYLLEILDCLDDDEITFGINGSNGPSAITCTIPFVGIIMPLRNS